MGCEMWDMPTIRMAHSEKADFEFALCPMPRSADYRLLNMRCEKVYAILFL
jgi:hypothetical protein